MTTTDTSEPVHHVKAWFRFMAELVEPADDDFLDTADASRNLPAAENAFWTGRTGDIPFEDVFRATEIGWVSAVEKWRDERDHVAL